MWDRALRHGLAVGVFCLAFVVNPAWVTGCAASDDDPDPAMLAKREAELVERLVEVNEQGAWEFVVGGERYEVLLALEQSTGKDERASRPPTGPRFTSTAHACGTHTFRQRASACYTRYVVAVEGTLTLRRLAPSEGDADEIVVQDIAVTGEVEDYETRLSFGDSSLSLSHREQLPPSVSSLEAKDLGAEGLTFAYHDHGS